MPTSTETKLVTNLWQFEAYQSALFTRDSNHLFVGSPTEESSAKYPFDFTVMLTTVVSTARRFFAWVGVERVERLEDIVELDKITANDAAGIKICSDAILHDANEQHLQKVYAILFFDQKKKRFVIAKRKLTTDEETATTTGAYRAELLREWASDPLSHLPPKKFQPFKFATHVFKFLYSAILWYWAVWAINAIVLALFFGAGVSAFSLGVTAPPLVAFLLPACLAILQYGFQMISADRNRHSANNNKAHALLENLVMLRKVAIGPAEGSFATREVLDTWARENSTLAPRAEANLVQQKIQGVKPRFRKLTSALVNFVNYFVTTASLMAPLYDLLAVNGIAVSKLALVGGIPMAVAPILLACVVGVVFAVFSYHTAKFLKADLHTKLQHAKEKLQTEYSDLVYEVRLRRAHLEAMIPHGIFRGHPLFTKLNHHAIEEVPLTQWVKLKKFCRRVLPFVRGTSDGGSFAFLLIAFIGTFAQLGLLASFSYFSPWVLAPLIGASIIWAALSLVDFVQRRGLRQARASLNTLPAAIAVYRHKNESLKTLELELKRHIQLDEAYHPTRSVSAAQVMSSARVMSSRKKPALTIKVDDRDAPVPTDASLALLDTPGALLGVKA